MPGAARAGARCGGGRSGSAGTLRGMGLGGGRDRRWKDLRLPARKTGTDARLLSGEHCLRSVLVTGALFFVSQGGWVRSRFHLQPRMIG